MDLLLCFDKISKYCFDLFVDKNHDYGPTWLLYRESSLNDEIWRKAKRIRTLEEHNDEALIDEGRDVEYIGIINYCLMFLIKNNCDFIPNSDNVVNDLSVIDNINNDEILKAYSDNVKMIRELLIKKNNDYGNAWQSMSIYSMTDQILMRNYRIRKIMENNGECMVSEGISSQLCDIINYCVFALIKMDSGLIDFEGANKD
jgi:hypothetical protein